MDLNEFKRDYYLFDPREYGRIFVFVDFSNVRHWAKFFWPEENKKYLKREIDIKKIADIANLIKPSRKFFYYGHYKYHPELPPEHSFNIKYRQSIYRIDKARKGLSQNCHSELCEESSLFRNGLNTRFFASLRMTKALFS